MFNHYVFIDFIDKNNIAAHKGAQEHAPQRKPKLFQAKFFIKQGEQEAQQMRQKSQNKHAQNGQNFGIVIYIKQCHKEIYHIRNIHKSPRQKSRKPCKKHL